MMTAIPAMQETVIPVIPVMRAVPAAAIPAIPAAMMMMQALTGGEDGSEGEDGGEAGGGGEDANSGAPLEITLQPDADGAAVTVSFGAHYIARVARGRRPAALQLCVALQRRRKERQETYRGCARTSISLRLCPWTKASITSEISDAAGAQAVSNAVMLTGKGDPAKQVPAAGIAGLLALAGLSLASGVTILRRRR